MQVLGWLWNAETEIMGQWHTMPSEWAMVTGNTIWQSKAISRMKSARLWWWRVHWQNVLRWWKDWTGLELVWPQRMACLTLTAMQIHWASLHQVPSLSAQKCLQSWIYPPLINISFVNSSPSFLSLVGAQSRIK